MKHVLFVILFISNLGFTQTARENVEMVYDQLVTAIGNKSLITPELRWSKSAESIASYDAATNSITFESRAYDICRRFGADSLDAVAYILAHELGHVYLKHGWLAKFKSSYASDDFGKEIAEHGYSLDTMKVYETQADDFACFYSSVAGYNSINIADIVIDSLYQGYELPDELNKYPSRNDRKLIVQRSREEVRDLVNLFEYAKFQFMLENLDVARFGYEFIARRFPSREIFNNIGVCQANMGLNLFPGDSILIPMPFQLDPELRVDIAVESGSGGTHDTGWSWPDEDKRKAMKLIAAADKNFDHASILDPEYFSAVVNKGFTSLLLEDEMQIMIASMKIRQLAKSREDMSLSHYYEAARAYFDGDSTGFVEKSQRALDRGGFLYSVLASEIGMEEVEYDDNEEAEPESDEAEPPSDDESSEDEGSEGAEGPAMYEEWPIIDGISDETLWSLKGINGSTFKRSIDRLDLEFKKLKSSTIWVGGLNLKAPLYADIIQIIELPHAQISEVNKLDFYARFGEPNEEQFHGRYTYAIYTWSNLIIEFKGDIAIRAVKYYKL